MTQKLKAQLLVVSMFCVSVSLSSHAFRTIWEKDAKLINSKRFSKTIFSQHNFQNYIISDSVFRESTFEEVDFSNATITNSDFFKAKFKRVKFSNARLLGNNFSRCEVYSEELKKYLPLTLEYLNKHGAKFFGNKFYQFAPYPLWRFLYYSEKGLNYFENSIPLFGLKMTTGL